MQLKRFMCLLACLTGCMVGRAAQAAEPPRGATAVEPVDLSVETDSPDALCPDLAATRRAVRDRIGQLALEGERRWVARYTIGHAPSGGGDYVQLVLQDGTAAVRLERRLPLAGESCETVVQAIALVLERYFRELQAPTPQPQPQPQVDATPVEIALVSPAPLPPAQPPRAERTRVVRSPAPPTLAPPLQFAAKAGAALGSDTGVLGLEVRLWFARWFQAALEPQLLVPRVSESVRDSDGFDRGSAHVLEVPLRGAVGLGVRSARLGFHVGPALRVSLRRAETELDGPSMVGGGGDASAMGWLVALGGAAGATWWPTQTWGVTTSFAVDAKLSETSFQVSSGSGNQDVLTSPAAEAQMLLGIAFGARP